MCKSNKQSKTLNSKQACMIFLLQSVNLLSTYQNKQFFTGMVRSLTSSSKSESEVMYVATLLSLVTSLSVLIDGPHRLIIANHDKSLYQTRNHCAYNKKI